MSLSWHQEEMGDKVISVLAGVLYFVYAWSRSKGKRWGYWENKWRSAPAAFAFGLLGLFLMLIWHVIVS